MSEMDQLTLARRLGTHRSPRVLPLPAPRPADFVAGRGMPDAAAALITGGSPPRGPLGVDPLRPLEPTEGDLRPAADRAVIAARIVSRVDSLVGHADIADLGVWALIDSVASDPRRVRIFFPPAAHALCTSDDATQRETVQTYLDDGGNVRVACEQLHIHRTRCIYRLDNLPQVVKDALEDGPRRNAAPCTVCMKLYEYHRTRSSAPMIGTVQTQRFVTSDGVDLAFDDTAAPASPLLLLHGWGQTAPMFRAQRAGPRPRHGA